MGNSSPSCLSSSFKKKHQRKKIRDIFLLSISLSNEDETRISVPYFRQKMRILLREIAVSLRRAFRHAGSEFWKIRR